jgi:uncharacterized protein (DUF608 family)
MKKPDEFDRRSLFKLAALSATAATSGSQVHAHPALADTSWPALKHYDQEHTPRFALPLGGIGTGTVSLYGNGSLRDWEVMSRPDKGFTPSSIAVEPFFALWVDDGETQLTRVLEGPLPAEAYEGSHGSTAPSVNLPRFRQCEVAASYPFARVMLRDPDLPVDVDLKAFNPMVPVDADTSGIPVAVLRYELRNKTAKSLRLSLCGTLPNFVGTNGWNSPRNRRGEFVPRGAKENRNHFRSGSVVQGIFMESAGVEPSDEAWGTLALATTSSAGVTHRTAWVEGRWGAPMLDFWDDFSADGRIDSREAGGAPSPVGSIATEVELPAGQTREVTFLIAWHFPNRYGWNLDPDKQTPEDNVGNYYTTRYSDAWDVIEKTVPELESLTQRSVAFVNEFLASDLPEVVKEAALFNASTLRTQTCFRTKDGRFFGWEGCSDTKGCCEGSCTHVWNYEQTTAYLFGSLALSMRDTEFDLATDDEGVMAFRVGLPLSKARDRRRTAADGQMGCIMKMYRDWQLSGDAAVLRELWPRVRKSLEFCWIEGGWDGDRDGVMEGVQHNTMDVEYLGPNPQMGFWYLGALRAAEEMARHVGEPVFASTCRSLYERGSRWVDANLFNGEYYEHEVRPLPAGATVPSYFAAGMGAKDLSSPDYQLAKGCLVDQLVGQFMSHVCGLGYLGQKSNIAATHEAILKYNHRDNLHGHFNPMRTYALDGEPVLLMADYPKERPEKPFPYFGEVMTGFEYTAAIGMLYEGMTEEGLQCMRDVRSRYDGLRRSPYDEAECGHHYARAMAAWAAVLALTGFRYSAVEKSMSFANRPGRHFWSTGQAWGSCEITSGGQVTLTAVEGSVTLEKFSIGGGSASFAAGTRLTNRKPLAFGV